MLCGHYDVDIKGKCYEVKQCIYGYYQAVLHFCKGILKQCLCGYYSNSIFCGLIPTKLDNTYENTRSYPKD